MDTPAVEPTKCLQKVMFLILDVLVQIETLNKDENSHPFLGHKSIDDDKHIDVDLIFNSFGRWPRYNIFLLFMTQLSLYVFCTQVLVMAFIGIRPPFYCTKETEYMMKYENGTSEYGMQCSMIGSKNDSIKCGTNGTTMVFDTKYGSTIATEWNLMCEKSSLVQLGTSVFMFGQLLGVVAVTQLSDHVGRRWPLILSNWGSALLGILSAFSPSFAVFLVFRFLMGITTVGVINVAWITCCETVGPKIRYLMPLMGNIIWTTSYCLVGVVAIYIRDWRTYCLVLFSPICLSVVMYWLIPETLYWLVAHNKIEAANKWIKRAEKYNKTKVNIEKCLIDKSGQQRPPKRHLGDVIKSPIILYYVALFSYIAFTGTIVYWGLSLFATNLGDRYTGFILSGLIELPAGFLAPLSLIKFGRRTVGICAFTISGISLVTLALVPSTSNLQARGKCCASAYSAIMFCSKEVGKLKTSLSKKLYLRLVAYSPILAMTEIKMALYLIGKFGNSLMWSATFLLVAEILPTTVRNVSYGIAACWGKVGSMVSPYLAMMGESNPSIPPAVFGIMSLIAAAVHFCFPETKGKEMPEDIKDVDPGPLLTFIRKKWSKSSDR